MGLDPGFRTGVKVAVVDGTGKVVATETIYPHVPARRWQESIATLARLAAAHHVELVAIGNGTASRETDKLAADLIAAHPDLKLTKVSVSEAGASVYSASAYGAQELPALDVSLRGAVSIARRLQDPLAELVKIDPKSIGVGQYQHDVSETGDLQEIAAGLETSFAVTMLDDGVGDRRAETGHARKKRRGGGVGVDADRVDAILDDRVERARELVFAEIVLVLADADRFWIDLDQLGERILQPARDGDGAAQRDVEIGKLFGGESRGRVDRGAGLRHDDLRHLEVGQELDQLARELVGLA